MKTRRFKIFHYLLAVVLLSSCQSMKIDTSHRPELADAKSTDTTTESANSTSNNNGRIPPQRVSDTAHIRQLLSDKDLERYAYELGFDPRQGLNNEEREAVYNRRRVRELERSLNSQKERAQYSKILPLLETDQEKIDLLTIESVEGRQSWINRNKVWSRVKPNKKFTELVEAQDIAMGMSTDLVKKSWGEPESVETSGNELYRNERWRYTRDIATPNGYRRERRFVYFEGGRVVGWESE
jgi:hypothetical protein